MDALQPQPQQPHHQQQQKPEEYQLHLRDAAERANRFLKERGYTVSQKNGQRISQLAQDQNSISSAHNLSNNMDHHNSHFQDEVFVGRIPRDLFEDELLPFMERAGPVLVIRLMMDFSGTTRGYCFVRYIRSEDASWACQHLTDLAIRPNTDGVGIKLSFDNKGLTFSGLPPHTTAAGLKKELSDMLDGVERVKLLKDTSPNKKKSSQNKSLTFEVQFKSHYCATQARRKLLPMLNKSTGSRQYSVDWARPETPAMNKARTPIGRPTLASINNQSISNSNIINTSTTNNTNLWNGILGQQEATLFGDLARSMLIDTNESTYDSIRSITLSNINLDRDEVDKVQRVFEVGVLKITRIIPSIFFGTFTVEFETREQAELVYEAVVLMPHSFKELSWNEDGINCSWAKPHQL